MELRHFRYFVAVAEEHSFAQAARRLRETVTLFERIPRGVRLTRSGEAFLAEARGTLEAAGRAMTSARSAGKNGASDLEFAHGELSVYTSNIEDLLAAFRDAHPEAQVHVSSKSDADTYHALREGQVDIASVFVAQWPVAGF